MSQSPSNNGTIVCTIGGTLLSMLSSIHADDLIKTCVLAAIGATVSFSISFALKSIAIFIKRKLN